MQLIPLSSQHLPAVLAIETANQYSPWSEDEFRRSIQGQRRQAWAAIENDELVGYAVFARIGAEVELLTISIAGHAQGRGLGRALLTATMEQLQFESLFLEVRASNSQAINLYESLGFNAVGQRNNYYPVKGGREDAIIYAYSRV